MENIILAIYLKKNALSINSLFPLGLKPQACFGFCSWLSEFIFLNASGLAPRILY